MIVTSSYTYFSKLETFEILFVSGAFLSTFLTFIFFSENKDSLGLKYALYTVDYQLTSLGVYFKTKVFR